jgi:hypothetical protein
VIVYSVSVSVGMIVLVDSVGQLRAGRRAVGVASGSWSCEAASGSWSCG